MSNGDNLLKQVISEALKRAEGLQDSLDFSNPDELRAKIALHESRGGAPGLVGSQVLTTMVTRLSFSQICTLPTPGFDEVIDIALKDWESGKEAGEKTYLDNGLTPEHVQRATDATREQVSAIKNLRAYIKSKCENYNWIHGPEGAEIHKVQAAVVAARKEVKEERSFPNLRGEEGGKNGH